MISSYLTDPTCIAAAIHAVRDQRVILDSDLAKMFGVETKRLNEQVKRNSERFGPKYAFQLSEAETDVLKSQIATPNESRGGRRTLPWAFTEYGVVMAATVLNSDRAMQATELIIDVFVDVKRRVAAGQSMVTALVPSPTTPTETGIGRLSGLWGGMGPKLQVALERVLDTVVDHRSEGTVRQEAQELISESIQSLKERLKKSGLENEELAARATKLLAEAEKERSIAKKTRAEAQDQEFMTIVKKLRLLLEAHRAMEHNELDGFLGVLKELGEKG
jgi:hypothetical protein